MKKLFTSESVTEGHPDKLCDTISDSILDAILAQDPDARVACETCATTGLILVMGEITTDCYVDVDAVARAAVREIGYTGSEMGFDADSCSVITSIHAQSPDIALGVDRSLEDKEGGADNGAGAGDQGMVFGYACDETEELMPLPIMLAHRIARTLTRVRKEGKLPYLRPDGKSQVTVEYEDDRPVRVDTVVVSSQHEAGIPHDVIERDIIEYVVKPSVPASLLSGTKYYINPTGNFVVGGPKGDSGLTGRKIIVDTYGGYCGHGGGAFSGKDPTKVDRSACYMARYVCKNIVAAGLARRCEMQIGYAIGVARPVSVYINTYGTGRLSDGEIAAIVEKEFDLRPNAIIEKLGLRRPIYAATAAYGHFGRPEFSWEQTDMAERLARYLEPEKGKQ